MIYFYPTWLTLFWVVTISEFEFISVTFGDFNEIGSKSNFISNYFVNIQCFKSFLHKLSQIQLNRGSKPKLNFSKWFGLVRGSMHFADCLPLLALANQTWSWGLCEGNTFSGMEIDDCKIWNGVVLGVRKQQPMLTPLWIWFEWLMTTKGILMITGECRMGA